MPNLPPVNTITRSATDFIKSSLRLVGSLRSGQNLSAAELKDSAQVLNDMLDAWSAERVMVFTAPRVILDQNQVALALTANQQAYTLGNILGTETWKLPRPPKLLGISVLYNASQSTPVELALEPQSRAQWQGIANKSTPSLLPQVYFDDEGFPDRTIYFWPIPSQANQIALYPWLALTQFADLESQFQFPPAYAEAIRYNLAMRLAAEFPCDLQKLPLVKSIASESRGRIVSMNSPVMEAWCDPALVGSGGSLGNIYSDTPARNRDS